MRGGARENPIHAAAKRNAPCSTCGAAPGESCTNRKGGNAWPPHKARLDWSARGCSNPYCRDGLVERGDNESRGAPAMPCGVCNLRGAR